MKKRISLPDTNFILRYLLRDHEAHFVESSEYFEMVRGGKEAVLITESVLVDMALTSSLLALATKTKLPS